jgi:maltoporin
LAVLAMAVLPLSASAGLLGDRIELTMYGRVGLAWGTNGLPIQGKSLNLMGNSIGGRFEEGDYLEPTISMRVLKPENRETDTYIDAVLTPAMWSNNGAFIGVFSNSFAQTLGIELFQAYVEAGNVFTQGLTFWGGARFYRGADVHIADYFYFNNLSGQGTGVKYKGLDLAVILHTNTNMKVTTPYNWDSNGDGEQDLRRERSVFVAQYMQKMGDHSLHFLGELHTLPTGRTQAGDAALPADLGWVLGAKGHFALPNDGFNDISLRYGGGAANGGSGGSQTWNTWGKPNAQLTYGGAMGIEAVDHFLYNFSPLFSVNAYGILHYNTGASGEATDKSLDFAVGARTFLYFHNNFHLVDELTFQGRQDGTGPLGTAVKFSIVPTIVPTGLHSVWARPHIRLIYTIAFYDSAAQATFGKAPIGHYVGTRVEWWF